ncbi:hypothetical protein [Mycoplasmoides pneumoniae]|nr:hypothetical protein [Mycoplasmoides pneumoniae]
MAEAPVRCKAVGTGYLLTSVLVISKLENGISETEKVNPSNNLGSFVINY